MFGSNASFHCDCVQVYTKKVIDVDGPSILDDLTGALICLQIDSIALRFCTQTAESAAPAVNFIKKSYPDHLWNNMTRSNHLGL